MFERLAEWVASWPDDKVAALLLQDMALCRAWAHSCRQESEKEALRAALVPRVRYWQGCRVTHTEETAGRRHQLLLRNAIELLKTGELDRLDGDQAELLIAAHDIVTECVDPAGLGRPLRLIGPHVQRLKAMAAMKQPSAGLAVSARRLQYVSEEDIKNAPVRETRLLAGIELPGRGPVMTVPSHVRILGDVPDGCTVVVEGSSHCLVDGYVMGRVLCKTHCEVRGNIAGAVIALKGAIRARGVVNNATVVAKLGSVHISSAQGPRLIFGGTAIKVAHGTMLGHYITREMMVGQDARGGRIEVSQQVRARRFGHLGGTHLDIVLRSSLSSEDFGEVTGKELKKLLSEAYRLRRQMRNFETIATIAQREAEHAARSVLLFLFGGSATQKRIEGLTGMQARLNLIGRMVTNLAASITHAEAGFDALLAAGAPELLPLDPDEPLEPELEKQRQEVLRLQKALGQRLKDRREKSQVIRNAIERLQRLNKERVALQAALDASQADFEAQGQYERLVSEEGGNNSKLQVLQKVLPVLRNSALNPAE